VAQGLTNAEIAKRLFISEATVKFHIRQILSKTKSTNRTEAVARVLGGTFGP
jgi:DNA-binding NarL/FixJ family response regulator